MSRSAVWTPLALSGLVWLAAAAVGLTTPGVMGTSLRVSIFLGMLPILLVAALAFSLRPDHNVARLFLAATGFSTLQLALAGTAARFLDQADARWWMVAAPLLQMVRLAFSASAGALLVLFPDGRSRTRVERGVVLSFAAAVVIVPLLLAIGHPFLMFAREVFAVPRDMPNPLFVSWVSPLGTIAGEVYRQRLLFIFIGAALLASRYRRSGREDRLKIKWPLLAMVLAAFTSYLLDLFQRLGLPSLSPVVASALFASVLLLIAASILFGLFRHRLLDVEPWTWRPVVYGVLIFVIGLAYVSVTVALGLAAGYRASVWAAVAVTLVAVFAFQPLRRRLETLARGRVFGRRLGGHELLTRFGQTLQGAYEVSELGSRLAETVMEGLELRWARISLYQDPAMGGARETTWVAGQAPDPPEKAELTVHLTHAGEVMGMIQCGPKLRGSFSPADLELLETVASQAALAIRNARLTAVLEAKLELIQRQAADLTASRARIVHAQDAERRRIERNIHDGIQQHVVVLLAKLQLARSRAGTDQAGADRALAEVQEDARRILADLRELTTGIHPPVLTDRGVVEAVEARISHMPIDVSIQADSRIRATRYAGEIEAAAYFMISEGLTNVLKHSRAKEANVNLRSVNSHLIIEVTDRGKGITGDSLSGSGLVGLRDRIEAVGGQLEIASRPGEGTTLRATLPERRVHVKGD